MNDSQIETLREMVRGAAPGSVLAVAPDVFDSCSAELAIEVGNMAGHRMTITRSPALKPGMVAVLGQHAGTPISGSPFGKYIGKFAGKMAGKLAVEEPGVEIEAAAPKPPKPPRPKPPAAPQPSLPNPPAPQRPRGPRQRIVDT
jgi:hypothetical protein